MIKTLVIVLMMCSFLTPTKSAYCDSAQYAQIVTSGEFLYRYDVFDQSFSNILCLLEKSYYVEVISQTSDKVRVNYNGVSGYVKPSAIRLVTGTPSVAYPTDIKILTYNKNCYLRTLPEVSENAITILPPNCQSLRFIGRTIGEKVEDFGENTWYYVEYLNIKGYVYSSYVSNISTIFPNAENLAYISEQVGIINPLTNLECIIIVIALSLPTMLILYIIFKKPSEHKVKRKDKINLDENTQ